MIIPVNNLRYYIIIDGYGTKDVTPLGESAFKISFDLNDDPADPRYGYDVTFKGTLTFKGEDYGWLMGAYNAGLMCAYMEFHLLSNGCDSATWAELLENQQPTIKLSEADIDLDKCEIIVPVHQFDPYECLNDRKGDALNMFDLITDPAPDVQLYDYVPVFEYSYYAFNSLPFDLTDQHFNHFPNGKAQYPGFSVEGQVPGPYWPETTEVLFNDQDLTTLERNATTYEEILTTGSTPEHNDYPVFNGAFLAKADGWRLYYFNYQMSNNTSGSNLMEYRARYRWIRERKEFPIGVIPPPDWIYVAPGVTPGTDSYARPPVLIPRTNKYIPSFSPQGGATVNKLVFMEATTYILGVATDIVDTSGSRYMENGGDGSIAYSNHGNVYGFNGLVNGRFLNDVINTTVGYCCPALTVKSEFLQINPDTTTDINPVTGLTTYTDKIMLFQKSDVKRPLAYDHATIGSFTAEELFGWLWDMFQVKYCIFGTDFRLEHWTSPYFKRPPVIDLTAHPYNRMLGGLRKFNFEMNDLPAKETFAFMESRKQITFLPTDDFGGTPILYYGNCVSRRDKQNVFDHKVGRITTDLLYVLQSSGGVSAITDTGTGNSYQIYEDANTDSPIADDGFCMMATKLDSGTYYGIQKPGILDTVERINNVLGWAWLHEDFYKNNRNALSGSLNGADITFAGTKYVKKQIELPFTLCCIAGFDPYAKIITSLGTGIIKTAEWSPATSTMIATVIFQL